MSRGETFTAIGIGSIIAGGIAAPALIPGRQDIFDVVNKNNSLGHQPLHLQFGYDPTQHLAFGGAALTF